MIATIIPVIEYNKSDCEQGIEWLIQDILKEVETELRDKIKSTPLKATIGVIYNAIYEDGTYDITGSGRPAGEQSEN